VLAPEAEGVLFFAEGALQERYQEAFQEGLLSQGFSGSPVFQAAYMEDLSYEGIGSAILASPALAFLERDPNIPVILFSWIDPALTPRSVRIVFDDSPLAVAAEAVRAFPSASGEIFVPSRPAVLSGRIEERSDSRKLRGLMRQSP